MSPAPFRPHPSHRAPGAITTPPLGSDVFGSFWMAGFEGADHVNGSGTPLALAEMTQRILHADADYAGLRDFGISTVRESIGWRVVERVGNFDFSFLHSRLLAAQRNGIHIAWTLCHYGWPADVDVFDDRWRATPSRPSTRVPACSASTPWCMWSRPPASRSCQPRRPCHAASSSRPGTCWRATANPNSADRRSTWTSWAFGHIQGTAPYRSVRFEHEHLPDTVASQAVGNVNYPNDHACTRTTKFKDLTGQQHSGSSIVREHAQEHGEPFHPIPRPQNEQWFKRYEALADAQADASFVGRLAQYHYYNMDPCVGAALVAAPYRTFLPRPLPASPHGESHAHQPHATSPAHCGVTAATHTA